VNSLVSQVLDRLVADIEAGKNPWKKSWKGAGGLPRNSTTSRAYRGINTLMLWLAEMDKGFSSSSWATFKQWGGAGRHVRKGEKGTPILFYKMLEKGEGDDARSIPMLRVSWVFNEAQLDEAAAQPQAAEPTPEEKHIRAMAWLDTLGMKIGQGKPCYIPALDEVRMPMPSDFDSLDEYWSTLFHEGVHWTGHKRRLARNFSEEFYAAEELVAEIGAAFLGANFGIDTEKNNAAYLRGWLSKFDDKRTAIFTAAKEAGRAFEFLTIPRQQMEQAA
jgi:antirestriction protein ArdC